MIALGFVVSDKKICESFILKTYFLTPWPTYATNWNGLNNFDRGELIMLTHKGQRPVKIAHPRQKAYQFMVKW